MPIFNLLRDVAVSVVYVNETCLLILCYLDREIHVYLPAKHVIWRTFDSSRAFMKTTDIPPHFGMPAHGQSDRQRVINRTVIVIVLGLLSTLQTALW